MQLGFSFEERKPKAEEAGESTPRIFSVSELTRTVRTALESAVGEVWVRGEISNFRRQASGHCYFTLKDDSSQLACVLFAGAARGMRGLALADGMQIQVFGDLTVYEARGQYQLVVRIAQEEGVGALRAKFEALKAKLAAEGLFDPARKRALPRIPRRIGVVTSPTGAAIRDFLKVVHRRFPAVEVLVHPVRVQGRGAAAEIASAVGELSGAPENGLPVVDVIVVTRGGGSLEDLWEFNEEVVARAIVESRIPVVSAVGHEIDFALSDFAADLRAPTPSAAAELLVPDAAELRAFVAERAARMARECGSVMRFLRTRLDGVARSALHREPARILRERRQQLDVLIDGAVETVTQILARRREAAVHAIRVISARNPAAAVHRLLLQTSESRQRLGRAALTALEMRSQRCKSLGGLLRTLSPEATLARGYSVTTDETGRVLRSAAEVTVGSRIRTRLASGEMTSIVEKKKG